MIKSALEGIVGREYVIDDPDGLQDYTNNRSIMPSKRPSVVVKPQSAGEVQGIVKLAVEKHVPIVPLSSGINFYGSTIPEQGGIMLDLRRMNRILKVDARNRAVMIEPGVTWGHLQDELEKHELRALNPLLPHPEKSVLTSHLEGEPMLIPKFEYGEPIYTMEVVLPNGEILRTGSAAGQGSVKNYKANLVGPFGPGIDFVRLFQGAQGAIGVVTWMNIKAEPLPKIQKLFFAEFSSLDKLVEYTYRVQRKLLGYECFAVNNFNLALMLTEQYPDGFQNLKKKIKPWCLIHCLGGTLRLPREKISYEEDDLKQVANEMNITLTTHIPEVTASESIILKYLRRPWDSEPYWKERFRSGCMDIFFNTTLDRVKEFSSVLSDMLSAFGFDQEEMGVYIQPIEHGRACHLEFNIPYQSDNPDAVEKVRALHSEACRALVDKGAFFTRPYGSWAKTVFNKNAGYTLASRQLKNMFDPHNIMNPGKLCF